MSARIYEEGVVRPRGFEPLTFCSGGKDSGAASLGISNITEFVARSPALCSANSDGLVGGSLLWFNPNYYRLPLCPTEYPSGILNNRASGSPAAYDVTR